MSVEEKIKRLQGEFRIKLDEILKTIEENHIHGKLDAGNSEINHLWTWYREEATKIRNEK